MSRPLERFQGTIVRRGDATYDLHRYQYAFSSHGAEGGMDPAAILRPTSTDDVVAALEHAARSSLAVALRTGGHHYTGASSTSGPNLLVDLRDTFRELTWDAARGVVRAGVGNSLDELNAFLVDRGLFVPHGQCSHVRLGGHVQTGGWGMLARSFGLLSDHVEEIEIVLADGTVRAVRRDAESEGDRDLFFAVLGGSPGRFGVLTHVTFRPLRDDDHPDARGLKFLIPYSRDRVRALLDVLVDLASDDDLAADYDVSVTVLGGAQANLPFATSSGLDEQMRVRHPEVYGRNEIVALPASISVYAQWANTEGAGQPFDPALFERIKAAAGYGSSLPPGAGVMARLADGLRPRTLIERAQNKLRLGPVSVGLGHEVPRRMSSLTRNWVFPNVREYNLPYVKRTYLSDSTSLAETGWAEWVSRRFDALVAPDNGCKGFLQVQHMGGSRSQFRRKGADGATAHSWRDDTTLCCVIDCFYDESAVCAVPPRQTALDWQRRNDEEAIGRKIFSGEDRRAFWGPWGDPDLGAVWSRYFDSRQKYERLCAIRRRVDPKGIFSANAFGVGHEPR